MATSLALALSSLSDLGASDIRGLSAEATQLLSMRSGNVAPPVPMLPSSGLRLSFQDWRAHLAHLSISELVYFLDVAKHGSVVYDSIRIYNTTLSNMRELDRCETDYLRSVLNGMLDTLLVEISTAPLPSFSSLQISPRSRLQHVLRACHLMTGDQLWSCLLEARQNLQEFQDSTTPSKLLDLPAEMRNLIYRDALCENSWVKIDHDTFAQPALLGTCKQIMQEASAIYYCENRFEVAALDMNAQLAMAFVRQAGVLLDIDKVRVRWVRSSGIADQLRAYHLLDWIAAYYFGHIKVCFKRSGENASVGPVNGESDLRACSMAFETVDELYDQVYWHNIIDALMLGMQRAWPFKNPENIPGNVPVATWHLAFWPKLMTWFKQHFEGSAAFQIFHNPPNSYFVVRPASGEVLRVDCFFPSPHFINEFSFKVVARLRSQGLSWAKVEIMLQRVMFNQHLDLGLKSDIAVWSRDQKAWIRTPWDPIDEDGRPIADAGQRAASRELWNGDMSAYGWQHVAAGYGERFCIEAEASVDTENGDFGPGGRECVPRYHFAHRRAHPGRS